MIFLNIQIGSQEFERAIMVAIKYDRSNPINTSIIIIPDHKGTIKPLINKDNVVRIQYGFRGGRTAIWPGFVSHVDNLGRDLIKITSVSQEKAMGARITEGFRNQAPETIVKNFIARAGLTPGIIKPTGVLFPHFQISNLSMLQGVNNVRNTFVRAHGVNMDGWELWTDSTGLVHWSDTDEPGASEIIESGTNLINLILNDRNGGLNVVESLLIPGLKDSQTINLKDIRKGISGSFRTLAVRHVIGQRIKTRIVYGTEYARV